MSTKCNLEGRLLPQKKVLRFLPPLASLRPQFASPMCTHSPAVLSFTDQIKKLEEERSSLQSAKAGLEGECKTLRQKVEILNELYQQKEMALQK